MFIRAFSAFVILPGIFAIIAPPVLGMLDPWRKFIPLPGLFVMVMGVVVLLWSVRDFYVSGKGTLAPWDPPQNLVVVGLYRYLRNPMYAGVVLLVLGWAILFTSPLLVAYTLVLAIAFHARVVTYEEPRLHSQFGSEWERYRTEVNRWRPRLRPWKGSS